MDNGTKMGMNVKTWFMALGIGILLAVFIGLGINTFYEKPEVNNCNHNPIEVDESQCDYLDQPVPVKEQEIKTYCWTQREFTEEGETTKIVTEDPKYTECLEKNQEERENYSRNLFLILLVLGIIFIIIGVFISDVVAVSGGLMFGGIINIIHGIVRYWFQMSNYLRLGVIGVGLIVLIGIAFWKLRD